MKLLSTLLVTTATFWALIEAAPIPGQKVHPIGFRLGIARPWASEWISTSKNLIKLNKPTKPKKTTKPKKPTKPGK